MVPSVAGLGTWQTWVGWQWQAGSGSGTAAAIAVCAYAYASIDDAYAYKIYHMLIRELIRALIRANTCYWQSISMLIQVDIQY